MINVIKVHHEEICWSCGDGCCTNYACDSTFNYDGKVYEFSGHSTEDTMQQFMEQVLNIDFEETSNYTDLDNPQD